MTLLQGTAYPEVLSEPPVVHSWQHVCLAVSICTVRVVSLSLAGVFWVLSSLVFESPKWWTTRGGVSHQMTSVPKHIVCGTDGGQIPPVVWTKAIFYHLNIRRLTSTEITSPVAKCGSTPPNLNISSTQWVHQVGFKAKPHKCPWRSHVHTRLRARRSRHHEAIRDACIVIFVVIFFYHDASPSFKKEHVI